MDMNNHANAPLLEDMNSKLDAVLELVQDVPEINQSVSKLKGDMHDVKQQLRVLTVVVKDHSHEIAVLKSN